MLDFESRLSILVLCDAVESAFEFNKSNSVRWAAVESLLTTSDNASTPIEEKARRYDLALTIQRAMERLDLSVDDLSFIKRVCDIHFAPLVMGQTRRMLEGEDPSMNSS